MRSTNKGRNYSRNESMIIKIKSKLKLVAMALGSIFPDTLLSSRYLVRARILFYPSIKERAYNGNIEAQFLLKLDFLGKVVYDIGSSIGILHNSLLSQ